jgi:hypothetical protein
MILCTHAVVGAALASFVPSHPAAAFAIGFASHFVLDAIPHWDYSIKSRSINPMIGAPIVFDSALLQDAVTNTRRVEPRVLKMGTKLSDPNLLPGEAMLKSDLDLWRGAGGSWAVNLSPMIGFPAIVVPAGFTREVYDRVPDVNDPTGSRLDGPKPDQLPVAMEFLVRPFDEALLFEMASAYEAGTKHRRPPKGFGPLAAEP